jgi:hypothetical protein
MVMENKKQDLSYFFTAYKKETAIIKALKEGYSKKEVGEFLHLSVASINKTLSIFMQKKKLFERLRTQGLFWSYDKNIDYTEFSESVFIEHTLKYGDFYDIKEIVKLFGKRKVKDVWEKTMKYDTRFIKVNYLIARVFLGLKIEVDDLKKAKNARLEKLKLLIT